MTDVPPPPAGPPVGPQAGWYANPDGDGLRWWDGSQWTDSVTDRPDGAVRRSGDLTPTGDWLSRSFRLAVSSLGWYMPVVLLAVIPWFMALAVCAWYGLRDGVMIADFETGQVDFEGLAGREVFVFAATAVATMGFLGVRLLYTTVSRNVAAAYRAPEGDGPGAAEDAADVTAEGPTEQDNTSASPLVQASHRWPAVSGVTIGRGLMYFGLYMFGSILAFTSPVLVLALPVVFAVIAWIWVRFALANAPAAMTGGLSQPLRSAYQATAGRTAAVFGRLVALTIIGISVLIVANLFGGIAASVSGSQPSETVEPFAETIAFNDVLPSNPAALAMSWVILAIGVGLWQVLSATAHTLLYLDLRGELGPGPETSEGRPSDR